MVHPCNAQITKIDGKSIARERHSQPSAGGNVTRRIIAVCSNEEQRASNLKRYAGKFLFTY